MVWSSASRENFVDSVQRMRERVTENIPAGRVRRCSSSSVPAACATSSSPSSSCSSCTAKSDPAVRQRATLDALARPRRSAATSAASRLPSSGRTTASSALLEHRLQLTRLRRTHLMPTAGSRAAGARPGDRRSHRAPARSSSAGSATKLRGEPPARAAVLPAAPLRGRRAAARTARRSPASQAEARLAAIGFRDPARRPAPHRRAHRRGVAARGDPAQPAAGHAAVVRRGRRPRLRPARVPAALRTTWARRYWFLRMLRDSSAAAHRLTQLLSGSRFVGALFERIPEAAAWLENDDELELRTQAMLVDEANATVARHRDDLDAAAVRPPDRAPPRDSPRRRSPPSSGSSPSRRSGAPSEPITTARAERGARVSHPGLQGRHRVRDRRDGPLRRRLSSASARMRT